MAGYEVVMVLLIGRNRVREEGYVVVIEKMHHGRYPMEYEVVGVDW